MKLILGMPCYGPVEPEAAASVRTAIMHSAAAGHTWIGDASPNRMKFDVGRNAIAQAAVDTEADYVFWCDSDILLPPDTVTRLLAHGRDFVSGIYFQRDGDDHWPLVAGFNGERFNWIANWAPDVLVPLDGCGFGCVITSVTMLRAIRDKFQGQSGEQGWFNYRQFSEDFDFCLRAKECGFQLWVDTGILCGHLADPEPVTFANYRERHPEFFGGQKNGGIRSETAAGDVAVPEVPGGRQGHVQAPEVQLR